MKKRYQAPASQHIGTMRALAELEAQDFGPFSARSLGFIPRCEWGGCAVQATGWLSENDGAPYGPQYLCTDHGAQQLKLIHEKAQKTNR